MIVSDPNPQVKPADETAALVRLAALLRGFSADQRRPDHERALFAGAAVLIDRVARLRDADLDTDFAAHVEDALQTAVRVATALRSRA